MTLESLFALLLVILFLKLFYKRFIYKRYYWFGINAGILYYRDKFSPDLIAFNFEEEFPSLDLTPSTAFEYISAKNYYYRSNLTFLSLLW